MRRSLVNWVLSGQLLAHGLAVCASLLVASSSGSAQGPGALQAKLVSETTTYQLGRSVGLFGDTAVAAEGGTVVVFRRTGASWLQEAALLSGNGSVSFVAISGETIAATTSTNPMYGPSELHILVRDGGAWSEQATIALAGLPGVVAADADTVTVTSAGQTTVFVRAGTTWTEQAQLPTGGQGAYSIVAVSGDRMVAPYGNYVRVFVRENGVWIPEAVLQSPSGQTGGVQSVAMSGDTLAVLAGGLDVFTRVGSTWNLQATLPGSQSAFMDLSEDGDSIVVGVPNESAGGVSTCGACYVYGRQGSSWSLQSQLVAPDAATYDYFGASVAVSGDTAITGAFGDDFDGLNSPGSVYVFSPLKIWSDLHGGLEGTSGPPLLSGAGSLQAGTPGSLSLSAAPSFTLSVFFASFSATAAPFKGGTLGALPIVFQLSVPTFLGGGWTLPWTDWPPGIPPGFNLYFQVAVADPAAIQGVSISNLLRATQP